MIKKPGIFHTAWGREFPPALGALGLQAVRALGCVLEGVTPFDLEGWKLEEADGMIVVSRKDRREEIPGNIAGVQVAADAIWNAALERFQAFEPNAEYYAEDLEVRAAAGAAKRELVLLGAKVW